MAITKSNGGNKSIYIDFSPTPGVLVISNDHTHKVLIDARTAIGEDTWKRGFDGLAGNSVARKVRKLLDESNVGNNFTLSGEIVAAYYSEREHTNGVYQDIRVKLKDGDESYLTTLPLRSSAAQLLIRKLANDAVQSGTEISAFSVFMGNGRKDENSGRTYYDTSVQLKDADGKEIPQQKGIFEAGQDKAKAAVAILEQSGMKDKELINKARASAIRNFYQEVLQTVIEPKFASDDAAEAEAESKQQPALAGTGGFDEMDDSVPF